MPQKINRNIFANVLLVSALILLAGCRTGPAGASFASVVIPNSSPQEICRTAATVFQEEGYQVLALDPSNMVFQREASRATSFAYGGVADTFYGSTTAIRVRASLVNLGSKGLRLQCKAYIVRNAGDEFFADESPVAHFRSGPYQSLLNKVAKQLK